MAMNLSAGPPTQTFPRTWPQAYSVEREESTGMLTLSTPYYTVAQDLKQGGAISHIALTHGRAANLLAAPIETRVRDHEGHAFSDLHDSMPTVTHHPMGSKEIVTVECALRDESGRDSGLRVRTTLQYAWGYVKIRKELLAASGTLVREVCPVSTVLAPTLTDFGYREGITEEEGAPPFSFGSNRWAKLRPDDPSDRALETPYVPRSMIFVDPGIEGVEWFAGSELSQWELQLTGRRGAGQFLVDRHQDPPGLAVSIAALWSPDAAVSLPDTCTFDFYLAVR